MTYIYGGFTHKGFAESGPRLIILATAKQSSKDLKTEGSTGFLVFKW